MFRFLKLPRLGRRAHANHARSRVLIGVLLLSMLVVAAQFLPLSFVTASAQAALPGPAMHKATFTLDGVTVTVNTPFLPTKSFIEPQPGDPSLTATSVSWHPYREFSVTAIPFGKKPETELVPVARAGGAPAYRDALYQFRVNQGAKPQIGPSIRLFGIQVTGQESIALISLDTQATKPMLVVEWVGEAGNRLWIVRISQEQENTDLAAAAPFLNSLSTLVLSSSTLAHPSTSPSATAQAQPDITLIQTSLSNPSWWNGTCDQAHYTSVSGVTPYVLDQVQNSSSPVNGLIACGPRPSWDSNAPATDPVVTYPGASWGVNEWECVELSMRYMYLAWGVKPYPANGSQVVSHYFQYKSQYNPNGPALQSFPNDGSNSGPQPGDVMSYGSTSTNGHTSVVASVNYTSPGNGSITLIQQNYGGPAILTYQVSGGVVQSSLGVTSWLHNPGFGGSVREDFNGDGRSDVMAMYDLGTDQNGIPSTGAYEWLGASGGALTYQGQIWTSPAGSGWDWSKAKWVSGDFNGDGKSDVIAMYDLGIQSNVPTLGVYEWLGGSGGALTYQGRIWTSPAGSGWDWSKAKFVAGDFNGDSRSDVMAMYDLGIQSGAPAVGAYEWLGTSSGVTYQGRIWTSPAGSGWDWSKAKFVAGDFNEDGKADIIAMYDLGTDQNGVSSTGAYEWLGASTSLTYQGRIWSSSGFTWAKAKFVAGDFNGDGRSDVMAMYDLGTDQNGVSSIGAYEWLGASGGALTYQGHIWTSPTGSSWDWSKAEWVP